MSKLFRRVGFGLLITMILCFVIDMVLEEWRYQNAKDTLNKDISTASFYALTSQNEYFGSNGFVVLPDGSHLEIANAYDTAEYGNYINTLANSGDEYLELSSMVLADIDFSASPYSVGEIHRSYNPAQLNLAFMNEDFIKYLFENCIKQALQNKGREDCNSIVLNNVDVNINFTLENLSPEVIRSIYGNDDTISDLFSSLSIVRFREISEVLSKSRRVPKYEVDFIVSYSYCTGGYFNSRGSINSNWFHRDTDNNFVTPDDVSHYGVKENQLKYPEETVTFHREYTVIS